MVFDGAIKLSHDKNKITIVSIFYLQFLVLKLLIMEQSFRFQGDSGGPLVVQQKDGAFILAGTV